MNIRILKLITGEEIIAQIVHEPSPTRNLYSIRDPLRIIVMPSRQPSDSPTIGFAPWLEFKKRKSDDTDIHAAHVICDYIPVEAFVDQYESVFSNILKPNQGLILPS
jgi:hypothetical protein